MVPALLSLFSFDPKTKPAIWLLSRLFSFHFHLGLPFFEYQIPLSTVYHIFFSLLFSTFAAWVARQTVKIQCQFAVGSITNGGCVVWKILNDHLSQYSMLRDYYVFHNSVTLLPFLVSGDSYNTQNFISRMRWFINKCVRVLRMMECFPILVCYLSFADAAVSPGWRWSCENNVTIANIMAKALSVSYFYRLRSLRNGTSRRALRWTKLMFVLLLSISANKRQWT